MPTLKLTIRALDNAQPRESPYWIWDTEVKGFGVRVLPSGRRSFVFKFRAGGGRDGAQRKMALGEYGPVTVEEARRIAKRLAGEVAQGRDPAEERDQRRGAQRAARQAPTVAALFDKFLADRERHGRRPSTLIEYRRLLGVTTVKRGADAGAERPGVLRATLGTKKVGDVSRHNVKSLHEEHRATPVMANRYVVILNAVFQYAEEEELRAPGSNPCKGVRLYKRTPRVQMLTEEQYRALGAALTRAASIGLPAAPARQRRARGMSKARMAKLTGRKRGPYKLTGERKPSPQNPVALAMLRFLALSGWRSSEAKNLRWREIDLARNVAVLPETKTGPSIRLLGRDAVAGLTELRHRADYPADTEFVFPAADPARPIAETDHVWAAIRHAADIEITLHGLRHAFITVARELGYHDGVIAPLVGHANNATQTSRYGGVGDERVRRAADETAAHLARLLDSVHEGSAEPAGAGAGRVLPFPVVAVS